MERRSIVLPLTPGPSPARGEGEYVSCSPDGLGNRKKAENRLCFAKEAPMKIQLALLALALVATDVRAEETVWIEAEHLQGVQGYCWPAGPNPKTDGHWGISGPGWAAEWTQGGESNFQSIACGPDDDKAIAGTDVEMPVASNYFVWVRFRDNRGATSRFQVRLTPPGASRSCLRTVRIRWSKKTT